MTTIISARRKSRTVPGIRAVALGLFAGAAWAPVAVWAAPLGPEFLINSTTADSQATSTARALAGVGGSYIVVWHSPLQDGDGLGVVARRYNASGSPLGPEFPVNTTTPGDQKLPSVDVDTGGNFVVVWEGAGTGDTDGVFAQRFNAAGTPQGSEIRVNETTSGTQAEAEVTVDNNGDFYVVWSGNGPGDPDGVFVRVFDSDGSPRTSEQRVNTDSLGVQSRPSIAVDSNGDHVVVWDGPGAGGDLDVFFQRFDGNGNPLGTQTLANTTTDEDQRGAAVARTTNGRFVVAWEGDSDSTAAVDFDVYAQSFNSDGSAHAGEIVVGSTTAQDQTEPSVDLESSGNYVVSWTSDADTTGAIDWNVFVRAFNRGGTAQGPENVVPTTSSGPQRASSVSMTDTDHFLVAWHGNGTGDDAGVFGRAYGTAVTSADVGVTQTVSNATPATGEQINLFLTLVNNGPDFASGVRVTDLLPSGLTYVTHFATQGDYDPVTGAWDVASMGVASSDVLRITVSVDPGTEGQTLTNTAWISALDQVDGVGANDTHSVDIFPQLIQTSIRAELQSDATLLPGAAPTLVLELELNGEGTLVDTLQALTVTNTSIGPGSQAELDASWSMLALHVGGSPVPLVTSSFSGGRASFSGLDLAVAPNDSVRLEVWGAATIAARDSDVLDLSVESATDVVMSSSTVQSASWPLAPAGTFTVDGMSSAQIQVHDVAAQNIFSGSTRNLALDITVPANGYVADQLQKLNIVNFGSASSVSDLSGLEAWSDDGDGSFDPASDTRLGGLVFTGNRWELTGLALSVPVGGTRVFVSVDIGADAVIGRTIRLGLADDTDVAIGMASANDGPLDAAVSNRFELSISTSDRVTVNAGALPSGSVMPGASEAVLLHIVTTNSYTTSKRLISLALDNATSAPNGGSTTERDLEFDVLRLHADGDGDGEFDGASVDPVIASTFFSQGRASFDAFAWDVPAGATRHLFVSADVSLDRAADGDMLGIQVANPLDLGFADPTAVIATWPLDSGARWTVDGMVAAQVQNHGAPGVTLGPGDGPVLALDVTLPSNGYADDVLQGVTLQNVGTAAGPDVDDMRLWHDGGDGVFTPGSGDDTEIGPLVLVGSTWKSPQLNENLTSGGLRLFVGVRVSATPSDSTSLQLALPVGGVQTASGNDGPLDQSIINPEVLLLSSAPLLSTLSVLQDRSVVGQSLDVEMTVRNVGTETIRDVTPTAPAVTGSGGAVVVSGPTPAMFDLAPSASATFRWTYATTTAGTLRFSSSAEGTGDVTLLPRRSLHTLSNGHQILQPADSLRVQPVGTMPFSVLRGETNVVPVSLTLTNPGGTSTAEIALTQMRLRVEDDAGTGLVPSEVLSRIALSEGSLTYVEVSTLPTSGAEVLLTLATPVLITPNEPVTVSLRCDVSPTTQQPQFRVSFLDSSWLSASDAVSGQAVTVTLEQGSFPLQSGTGQIRAAPTQLEVAANPMTPVRAGYGQTDVLLLDLTLRNPGVADLTSDVVLSALEFSVLDTNDQPLSDPSRFFDRVRVKSGVLVFEDHTVASTPNNTLMLNFALPVTVAVNATTSLTLVGDIANGAPLGDVRLQLSDPAMLDARDVNTSAAVPIVYTNAPLQGGTISLESPASGLRARGTPSLPGELAVGSTGTFALIADLRHPDSAGTGRVRVQSFRVSCRDEARRALASDVYLDQVRLLRGAQELARVTQIPASGSLDVLVSDLVLEPGETASVSVEIDLETTAPASFFELVVDAITASDENLGNAVSVTAEDDAAMPLVSGLTQLESPATELVVALESRIPAVLVGDGSRVPMARLALTNTAPGRSGSIQVEALVLRAGDRNKLQAAIGRAVARAFVHRGSQLWAASDSLTADSLTVSLRPSTPLVVGAGETVYLDVSAHLNAAVSMNGFRLGVQSQDVRVVQPASAVLAIRVQSEPGTTFPLWTRSASFSVASLRESYTNFPNPFAAGRERTVFGFYLSDRATVSLRILSPRGELVSTLIESERLDAGMHQSCEWRGRNERQRVVTNGVYVAELVVVYPGGRTERVLRKVAVVR